MDQLTRLLDILSCLTTRQPCRGNAPRGGARAADIRQGRIRPREPLVEFGSGAKNSIVESGPYTAPLARSRSSINKLQGDEPTMVETPTQPPAPVSPSPQGVSAATGRATPR